LTASNDATATSDSRRRWTVLVVLCVGQLMIVLDATVVNVALPAIQRELHFSQASLAWVVNAYLLTFGGLLLLAGRLGDLIGRVQVFLIGLAAFVVSSTLCGLAPTAGVLVAARFIQGASAAMVASMVLGIISPMFPEPRERTTALSIFAFVAIGGASLGLVLGGLVTELLSWHWIFYLNVPVGITALIFGRRLLDNDPGIGIREGADVLGAVLVTCAPMLAVFGLVNAGSQGWGAPLTIGPIVASVLLAGLFVMVESRVRTPLIPLRIFRYRSLSSATIVRTLFPMGGFGFNFIAVLYFQHVLGYSALVTGLAFLPSSAVTGAVSLGLAPWLLWRIGPKPMVVTGLVLLTSGLLAFARVPVHAHFMTDIFPTMILTGVGFGLMFMPSVSIAMSEVTPSESGVASGLTNVAVQIGASIGVAAFATISATRTSTLLAAHVPPDLALTSGYRVALLAAAGCTTASLLAAIILLPARRPNRLDAAVVEEAAAVIP
jgi:EmrB/QacA subfamily drug resistance transporter